MFNSVELTIALATVFTASRLSTVPITSGVSLSLRRLSSACLLVLCMTPHCVFAAPLEGHIDSWTTENGLAQSSIRDMDHMRDGYLRLAREDGMVRFDGVRFEQFNRSNALRIFANRFTSLCCTPSGAFWAGGAFTELRQHKQGQFTTYTAALGFQASDIPAVIGYDAGDNCLLFQTSIVRRTQGEFQPIKLPAEEPKCVYRTWWFLMLALAGALGTSVLTWLSRASQLKRAHAMQQAFSRQLIASQEDERRRIAAELHDGLGQELVVIKNLALLFLRDAGPEGAGRPEMEEISAQASHALSEVRKICYNLRPYQLDRLGLTKAITGMLQRVSTATCIAVASDVDPVDDLFSSESEINFYRIVQECISNVVKHAEATCAKVSIRHAEDELALMIQDNGTGLKTGDSPSGREVGGFGLLGVSERTELLGGKLAIFSEPGRGTTISVRIPLHGDQHGQ